MKKKVQRMCAICNERKEKNELIRLVKNDIISVDKTGKKPGRGIYICCSKDCLEKAKKTKKIQRVLDCILDDSIYDEIEKEIINRTEKKDCEGDIIG